MTEPAPEHRTDRGEGAEVRVANPVITTLRNRLDPDVRAMVLRTIESIGRVDDEPLDLAPAGQFRAITPPGDAPVVVYRQMTPAEGHGYLVTGLVDRQSYQKYKLAQDQGLLDTDAGRAMLRTAVTAVTGTCSR
jgi:hypothetical protein